ncbi:MAG UNVERIFIED_CONTAM: hypothetical protein LVR18_22020 [Planctomycetaceae bacterium]|jgi:hypothetical protein
MTAGSDTDADVGFVFCEQQQDLFDPRNGFLKVGRHDSDEFTGGVFESCANGGEAAEVAGMADDGGGEGAVGKTPAELLFRVVGAAVNDKDHRQLAANLRSDAGECVEQIQNVCAVSVDGDDDGESGH